LSDCVTKPPVVVSGRQVGNRECKGAQTISLASAVKVKRDYEICDKRCVVILSFVERQYGTCIGIHLSAISCSPPIADEPDA